MLKFCPFCGSIPTTRISFVPIAQYEEDRNVYFSVVCEACGISKTIKLAITKPTTFADITDAMNSAVNAWNERYEK